MQTSPTDGQGLKWRPEEFEALAARWPRLPEDVRADWLAKMNRAQRRRFERTVANIHEDQRLYASKVMTRQDTVNLLALFIQQNIMPVAARLDAVEAWIAFQERPWYQKLAIRLAGRVARAQAYLASKGIQLVRVDEAGDDTNAEGNPGPGEPTPPSPAHSESAGGSVSGDATAATGMAEGARPADSLIEVVPR